jgi:voltage-gated potassium channel
MNVHASDKINSVVYFWPVVVIVMVIALGTVGYHFIEGWGYFDSFYMTLISITTVGYGEIKPLSQEGRMFTVFIIVFGIGFMGYSASKMVAFIVEGELSTFMKRRKMKKEISLLRNHYIVCGAGDTGINVINEFSKADQDFVIIDSDPLKIERLENKETIFSIVDDAVKDSTLQMANIEHAKGLVAVLHSDKDNLFVVLTARALNPKIKIVARVIDQSSEKKMLIAGADQVVSPNYIGGMRLASLMIRPAVVDFLDEMLKEDHGTLRLEEVAISEKSPLVGQMLRDSRIPQKTGLIILALKLEHDGRYAFNPSAETVLSCKDKIIVMGKASQVDALRQLS